MLNGNLVNHDGVSIIYDGVEMGGINFVRNRCDNWLVVVRISSHSKPEIRESFTVISKLNERPRKTCECLRLINSEEENGVKSCLCFFKMAGIIEIPAMLDKYVSINGRGWGIHFDPTSRDQDKDCR